MIDRYTTEEMLKMWSEEHVWGLRLKVELAIMMVEEEFGLIPAGTFAAVKDKASFDVGRIKVLEKETHHDVMAFVKNVQEGLGEEGRFVHFGVTSYDVQDTASSMLLRDVLGIIIERAKTLRASIRSQACEHRNTLEIGRTHGIHAEPITFGFKLAGWFDEMNRNIERLEAARLAISVGKISGAVGTHVNTNPEIERAICESLGLAAAPFSTQIISRDRHAQVVTTLAILCSSLERFATELRNLARTEIREVQEYFAQGQKGSSAMPHKRNPWNCETITGLARVARGYVIPALETVCTWHERDLANSSLERIIWPDITGLADWMLFKFTSILDRLIVYPDRMQQNLELMGGLVCSEQVMMALIETGLSREEAYTLVQRNAALTWEEDRDFQDLIAHDLDIAERLTPEQVIQCFDVQHHLRNLYYTFEQLGI